MEKLLTMFVIAIALTGNAYAATETNPDSMAVTPVAATSEEIAALDVQAAFQQDTQPMELAALSEQEMTATEGAWFGGISWGSALGNLFTGFARGVTGFLGKLVPGGAPAQNPNGGGGIRGCLGC